VLVVDDAEQSRTLITTWLMRRPRTRVVAVDRAGAAIASIKRERIDIVLLDMMMPGIDGYAAARLLRALPQAKRIPIVAITAKTGDEEREECLAAGCSEYLPKPFNSSTRNALIDRLAQEAARDGEPRDSSDSRDSHSASEEPRSAAQLDALAEIDRDTQALVQLYLENRCAEVSVLESALEKRDLDTLRNIGHNLRGSGGSYGFPTLTEIGERIETAAKAADHTALAKEVAHLREHLTEVLLSRGG
jgi:CheY-like chemotaxis protein